MKRIAIFGAGGFGREVRFLLDDINKHKSQWEFVGYYDDGYEAGTLISGYPVLGGVKELNNIDDSLNVVIAIGDSKLKKQIANSLTNTKLAFPVLIHPSFIGDFQSIKMGKGVIICASNIITVDCEIGDFVIVNLACTIGHDAIIGDYASLMPSVNISGEVEICECVYLGTGSHVVNKLTIGRGTIVGAGAVVASSLPENCTAVGVPAKPIKIHTV